MKFITAAATLFIFLSSGCKDYPPETWGPFVEIVSPKGNISNLDSSKVIVSVSGEKKIVKVELFIDHTLAKVFAAAPYEYSWYVKSFPDGSQHLLEARAYDDYDNVTAAEPVVVYTYKFRPSDLIATFDSDTTVNLFWVDNCTGESYFEVEKRINNGEFMPEQIVPANFICTTVQCKNAFTDSIYFRIRAVKGNENSEYSNYAMAKRSLSAPSHVDIGFTSDTTIHVTWKDNSKFESGFRIKIGRQVFDNIPANATECSVPVHMISGWYYYAIVTAVRDNFSSAEIYSPYDLFAVPEPYELSMVREASGGVTISWKDSCSYETGFIVERADSTKQFSIIGKTGANVLHFTDTNIDTLKRYVYRVKTETKYTVSQPSKELTVGFVPALSLSSSRALPSGVQSLRLGNDQRVAASTTRRTSMPARLMPADR